MVSLYIASRRPCLLALLATYCQCQGGGVPFVQTLVIKALLQEHAAALPTFTGADAAVRIRGTLPGCDPVTVDPTAVCDHGTEEAEASPAQRVYTLMVQTLDLFAALCMGRNPAAHRELQRLHWGISSPLLCRIVREPQYPHPLQRAGLRLLYYCYIDRPPLSRAPLTQYTYCWEEAQREAEALEETPAAESPSGEGAEPASHGGGAAARRQELANAAAYVIAAQAQAVESVQQQVGARLRELCARGAVHWGPLEERIGDLRAELQLQDWGAQDATHGPVQAVQRLLEHLVATFYDPNPLDAVDLFVECCHVVRELFNFGLMGLGEEVCQGLQCKSAKPHTNCGVLWPRCLAPSVHNPPPPPSHAPQPPSPGERTAAVGSNPGVLLERVSSGRAQPRVQQSAPHALGLASRGRTEPRAGCLPNQTKPNQPPSQACACEGGTNWRVPVGLQSPKTTLSSTFLPQP